MTGDTRPIDAAIDPQEDSALLADDSDPAVARSARTLTPVVLAAAFAIAAILLFVWLNGMRTARAESALATPAAQVQAAAWTPPPALELPATPISASGPAPFSGLPAQVGLYTPPTLPSVRPALAPGAPSVSAADLLQRRRAPALIVDLGGAPREMVLAQAGAAPATAIGSPTAGTAPGGGQRPQLTDTEQFAQRVGDETPDRARAVPMRSPHAVAPQGTIIPGVLETAINSDLPGFTRAVVSRDVLSFDGKAVLIPRGSRLIGQYKSAVALGQSRAFIIWTRVIRPDGVSIQIGSPGTDELGRGGLAGDVDRHFFRRFSGSILLSVLNAAVASVGRTPSTQISIGSPGAAAGAATAALQGDAIPPTITVRQGEAINIFVARDLDFSAVEAVR